MNMNEMQSTAQHIADGNKPRDELYQNKICWKGKVSEAESSRKNLYSTGARYQVNGIKIVRKGRFYQSFDVR